MVLKVLLTNPNRFKLIGFARNPSLKQQLFSYAILGFALSEAMGLFCLTMGFLILFAL
jgi:F-type H+-transporting ATPase subunit c